MAHMHKILVVFFAFLGGSTAYADEKQQTYAYDRQVLYRLVGELIIERDITRSHMRGPDAFAAGPISSRFEQFYKETIRHMDDDLGVDYFLATLWHLDLDMGGPMDMYMDIVQNDPALDKFIARLETFVNTADSLGRPSPFLEESRLMLRLLKG